MGTGISGHIGSSHGEIFYSLMVSKWLKIYEAYKTDRTSFSNYSTLFFRVAHPKVRCNPSFLYIFSHFNSPPKCIAFGQFSSLEPLQNLRILWSCLEVFMVLGNFVLLGVFEARLNKFYGLVMTMALLIPFFKG